MSCMIADSESISKIVDYIAMQRYASEYYQPAKWFENLGVDFYNPKSICRLGLRIWALNTRAFRCRYGGRHWDSIGSFWWIPKSDSTALEIYKHLVFLLYQCSDGNTQEPLYIALDKFKNYLAHEIVHNLPEYADLPWC